MNIAKTELITIPLMIPAMGLMVRISFETLLKTAITRTVQILAGFRSLLFHKRCGLPSDCCIAHILFWST
jgi:hypothetical protein